MNMLEAVILGIVQGLAEFLPVSSSGHLVLFEGLFGINEPSLLFEVVLHIGTLIPVLFVYRKSIWKLIRNPFQKKTLWIIVGTIPAVIAALLFGDLIESLFSSVGFLAVGFTITGIVLILAERAGNGHKDEEKSGMLDALLVGCAQAVAILPGISRSGSTIAASLGRKLDRETAAEYSFLLSIPAILGALVLQLKNIFTGAISLEGINYVNYGVGFVAAMLSGYLAINFMLKLIKNAKLWYFSIYVFILAAIVAVDTFLLGGAVLG